MINVNLDDAFERITEEFNDIFGKKHVINAFPNINVVEVPGQTLWITAQIPGFSKDHIILTINDNILNIEGDISWLGFDKPLSPDSSLKDKRHITEYTQNLKFHRKFKIGKNLDISTMSANVENGILKIKIDFKFEKKEPIIVKIT